MASQILNDEQMAKLIANGRKQQHADATGTKCVLVPPVLLRLPSTPPSVWLLASVDPEEQDVAFGLMSVAGGPHELGYVRLSELKVLTGYKGRGVYHDPLFAEARELDLNEYVQMAEITGQIVLEFDA